MLSGPGPQNNAIGNVSGMHSTHDLHHVMNIVHCIMTRKP
jgi:hypothetical protein